MEALDRKIRPLYKHGLGCRVIGAALDENPVIILRRVRMMGIVRTVKEAEAIQVLQVDVPFSREPDPTALRWSGVATAIQWFMDRGYMVSIPVEPARYDLVVESDQGLQRVQVKTTNTKDRGRWITRLHRKAYDASVEPNASGKTKPLAYTSDEIDLFFIVAGDRTCYLIPLEAVTGQLSANLDDKFAAYRVA